MPRATPEARGRSFGEMLTELGYHGVTDECLGPLPAGMVEALAPFGSIWNEGAFGSYSPA